MISTRERPELAARRYQQGHVYMFQAQGTGRLPYSGIDYHGDGIELYAADVAAEVTCIINRLAHSSMRKPSPDEIQSDQDASPNQRRRPYG